MYTKLWNKALLLIFLVVSLSFSTVSANPVEYDLTYDNAGNMQQSFDQYQEYDDFNRLVRVRANNTTGDIIEEYTYDQDGQRLSKYEPTLDQTTYYWNDNYIEIVNATGSFKSYYYHQDDVLVAREDDDGTNRVKYFYHPDHLGSTDLITDQSGNTVEETTYKPYGQVIDGGATSDFLYTGKEKDSTNLYYYGARYYDPFFRHFTQPDVNIPDVYDPQDLNRYAYVRNNPYKYVDPSGEFAVQFGINLRLGVIGLYTGEFGIAYARNTQTGANQFGFYTSKGPGLVSGISTGISTPLTVSPEAQTLSDIKGKSYNIGFSAGEVYTPSVSFNYDASKGIFVHGKSPTSYTIEPFSVGLEITPPAIPLTVSATYTETKIYSGREKTFNNNQFSSPPTSSPIANRQISMQNQQSRASQTSQNRISSQNRQSAFRNFFNRIRSRFRGNK